MAIGLAACGGEGPSADDAARDDDAAQPLVGADSSASSYVAIDVVDGGAIRGVVRYEGDVPEARVLSVTEDSAACGAERFVRSVLVGLRGGLADAVVSLVDVSRGKAFVPESVPTLDQRGCSFIPHVLLAPSGVPVRILNSDPLVHNVHTAAFENRSVNRSQPAGSGPIELSFGTPEKVKVKCDLHPWMGAWIIVTDHPYHAVTDDAGAFELADIPPGDYILEAWHETLGTSRHAVSIMAGEARAITIDMVMGG